MFQLRLPVPSRSASSAKLASSREDAISAPSPPSGSVALGLLDAPLPSQVASSVPVSDAAPLTTNGLLANGPASPVVRAAQASVDANEAQLVVSAQVKQREEMEKLQERLDLLLPVFNEFARSLPAPPVHSMVGVLPAAGAVGVALAAFFQSKNAPTFSSTLARVVGGALLGGAAGAVAKVLVSSSLEMVGTRPVLSISMPQAVIETLRLRAKGAALSPSRFEFWQSEWRSFASEWNAGSISPAAVFGMASTVSSVLRK